MKSVDFLLASNSPRRRELLSWTGWTFEVCPSNVDERQGEGEAPLDYVRRLAESKALAAASRPLSARFILAADTIVVLDGEVLGKPANSLQAVDYLRRLRGREHQVITAIAVMEVASKTLLQDTCRSTVLMRNYQDAEIEAYVQSGDPLDKAGGYAIQHPIFRPVANFQGCFASVMGLPLCHLVRTMERFAEKARVHVAQICQANLNYACPVYAAILRGEDVG